MAARGGMAARVLRGRGVAAADMTALGAAPQVEPPAAGRLAFDAARAGGRHAARRWRSAKSSVIGRLPGEPKAGPRRAARRLDQLDEDAVARARVEERDRALGARAAARCRSAPGRRSRGGAASRRGSGPRSRRGGSPRPSMPGSARPRSCRRWARRARPSTRRRRGRRCARGRTGCPSPSRARGRACRATGRANPRSSGRSARRDGPSRARPAAAGGRLARRCWRVTGRRCTLRDGPRSPAWPSRSASPPAARPPARGAGTWRHRWRARSHVTVAVPVPAGAPPLTGCPARARRGRRSDRAVRGPFARVQRFEGVVWLEPEPAGAVRRADRDRRWRAGRPTRRTPASLLGAGAARHGRSIRSRRPRTLTDHTSADDLDSTRSPPRGRAVRGALRARPPLPRASVWMEPDDRTSRSWR